MIINSHLRPRHNAAAYFDGSGDAYISVPTGTTSSVLSSGEFTILCAFKTNSGASGNRDIVGSYVSSGNDRSFLVRLNSSSAVQVFISTDGTSSNQSVVTSSNTFTSTSAWYYVGVSVSISEGTNADRVKLYVNGSSEALGTPTGTFGTPFNNGQDLLWAGRAGTSVNLDAYLCLPFVLDRPLTATEHSRIYNSGDPLYPLSAFPGDTISYVNLETGEWDGSQWDWTDNENTNGASSTGMVSGDLVFNAGIYDQ